MTNPIELAEWTPVALRTFSLAAEKTQTLQEYTQRNKINADGLPLHYIDAQYIIEETPTYSIDELLNNINTTVVTDAIVPLNYGEGFPTTPEGLPVWERLEGEPFEHFQIFKHYRDSMHIAACYDQRTNSNSNSNNNSNKQTRHDLDHPKSLRAARTLHETAIFCGTPRSAVKLLSKLYHWTMRAKAYDLYRASMVEKIRAAEVDSMHSVHLNAAREIFNKCLDWLDKNVDELNPKTALEWFQTAVQLERLSLGLSKDRPQGELDAERVDRRPWVQINQLQQQNGQGTNQGTNQGGQQQGTQVLLGMDDNTHDEREARLMNVLSTLQGAKVIDLPKRDATPTHAAPTGDDNE